ncbi:MAG: HDOD domain-containing protein, partial [Giesbergeria sp.]
LSRLDELLGEPVGTILHRIPLSDRVFDAIVMNHGPYAPCLQMARALETDDSSAIRQLCTDHEMVQEDVNRILLRTLANTKRGTPP